MDGKENSAEITLRKILILPPNDDRPEDCPEEDGDGDTCKDCPFISSERVSHPGGSSYHSVNKYTCNLGYWEDNF